MAHKRFNNETLEGECVNYVIEKLSEDDWCRCKEYKGMSKPTTFLFTLVSNLVEEFARVKFGRPRPPSWLKKQGELWVDLWKVICLERQLIPSVVDRFTYGGIRTVELVQAAIQVIKARIPGCGQSGFAEFCTENITESADAQGHSVEDTSAGMAFERQAARIYRIMIESIVADPKDIEPTPSSMGSNTRVDERDERLNEKLEDLRQALSFTDQEKVLLRMIYVDGVSKSTSALAIGLPSHQGGRMVNEVLKRIKFAMDQCRLELSDFMVKL